MENDTNYFLLSLFWLSCRPLLLWSSQKRTPNLEKCCPHSMLKIRPFFMPFLLTSMPRLFIFEWHLPPRPVFYLLQELSTRQVPAFELKTIFWSAVPSELLRIGSFASQKLVTCMHVAKQCSNCENWYYGVYSFYYIILGGNLCVSIFVTSIHPKMDDLNHFQANTQSYWTCYENLRGYCTPGQFLDCFCIFLKNYNTLVTSKICFL